jgi:hypothetical protein
MTDAPNLVAMDKDLQKAIERDGGQRFEKGCRIKGCRGGQEVEIKKIYKRGGGELYVSYLNYKLCEMDFCFCTKGVDSYVVRQLSIV